MADAVIMSDWDYSRLFVNDLWAVGWLYRVDEALVHHVVKRFSEFGAGWCLGHASGRLTTSAACGVDGVCFCRLAGGMSWQRTSIHYYSACMMR